MSSLVTYKYTARNTATGKKVSAEISAENKGMAAKLIAEQGLSALTITPKAGDNAGFMSRLMNRITTKDKIIFSRQLSTLINAGLPLVQSLRSVLNQTKNTAFKAVISQVIADVEAGTSLSVALGKHPRVFNNIFVSLVEAGEASGTLDRSLERLAFQQEKDAEVVSKVRGAMVYPIIVLVVMVGVVSFMLVSVLPQVQELYKGFGNVQLPILTRFLLVISNFIINYWWVVLVGSAIGSFFLANWARTPEGKSVVDNFKKNTPPFGTLFMKMYMARFARTATTLVGSGVPFIQVLEITSGAVDNVHVGNSIKKAIEMVKGGRSLADAIQNDKNFLELVPNMLRIGEQSGRIEDMLAKTADYYEKEVDDQIKTVSTIIEPLLMIVLGIVAVVIVSAILVPIYSLVGKNVIR